MKYSVVRGNLCEDHEVALAVRYVRAALKGKSLTNDEELCMASLILRGGGGHMVPWAEVVGMTRFVMDVIRAARKGES